MSSTNNAPLWLRSNVLTRWKLPVFFSSLNSSINPNHLAWPSVTPLKQADKETVQPWKLFRQSCLLFGSLIPKRYFQSPYLSSNPAKRLSSSINLSHTCVVCRIFEQVTTIENKRSFSVLKIYQTFKVHKACLRSTGFNKPTQSGAEYRLLSGVRMFENCFRSNATVAAVPLFYNWSEPLARVTL